MTQGTGFWTSAINHIGEEMILNYLRTQYVCYYGMLRNLPLRLILHYCSNY